MLKKYNFRVNSHSRQKRVKFSVFWLKPYDLPQNHTTIQNASRPYKIWLNHTSNRVWRRGNFFHLMFRGGPSYWLTIVLWGQLFQHRLFLEGKLFLNPMKGVWSTFVINQSVMRLLWWALHMTWSTWKGSLLKVCFSSYTQKPIESTR